MDTALPESSGLDPDRLARAYRLLDEAAANGEIPGAVLLVGRHGQPVVPHVCGRQYLSPDSPPIRPETIFLVASVTKPVTATAVMLLVERGDLQLSDAAAAHLPEFGTRGKESVSIRHLLTHTSGLPDMLPDDRVLRRRHAPLTEFVREICELDLVYAPGTQIRYQSSGFAILGAIVERIAGLPLPEFLRREVFVPLGMADTGLGAAGLDHSRIAHVDHPAEMQGEDWGWNQPYWRNLAAPWGGLFTTAPDFYRFCQLFLDGGTFDETRILSTAAAAEMMRNQTDAVPIIPAEQRYQQAWGLGWGMAWRRQLGSGWSYFGDLVLPETFGHGGATGTVVWVDPLRELICVLFTTAPGATRSGLLARCSNLVAAAAV